MNGLESVRGLKSRLLPVDLCDWTLTNFRFRPLKAFVLNRPFYRSIIPVGAV